jgi:hypothetical protein
VWWNVDRTKWKSSMLTLARRVVLCGNYDACALPGRQQPIHAKVNHWNELPAIRSNPHSYMDLFDSGHE